MAAVESGPETLSDNRAVPVPELLFGLLDLHRHGLAGICRQRAFAIPTPLPLSLDFTPEMLQGIAGPSDQRGKSARTLKALYFLA